MKRMKLKKRKNNQKGNFILLIIIFLLISIVYILKLFSQKALPIFLDYSEVEVNRIASLVINNSIINEIGTKVVFDDLFIIKEDNNGNIVSMDINSAKVNKLLIEASKLLDQNLKYLETGEIDSLKVNGLNINSKKKGVIYELPSGIIFNNLFLNNLLPKIPVRLNLVGSIFCKLTTDVESYGINNAIFRVNINATTTVRVVLPFTSKNITLEASIPVIIKIIEGDVPNYYFGGNN
jgi:sporulation protein YunB